MCNHRIIAGIILIVLAGFGVCWGDFVPRQHSCDQIHAQADEMLAEGNFYQGYRLYKYITQNNPNYEDLMRSYVGKAVCAIGMGHYPAAEEAVNKLLADFADVPGIGADLSDIAGHYQRQGKFGLALRLYDYVIESCPDYARDMDFYGGLAISSAAVGKASTATDAVNMLLNEYGGYDSTPKILNQIGQAYRHSQSYAEAEEVFQLVVDYWPQSQYAIQSEVGIIKSRIDRQQDATEAINAFLNWYIESEALPECLCDIAEHYQEKGEYGEAADYFNFMLDYWPGNEQAVRAYQGLIEISIQSENYAQADALLERFVNFFGQWDQARDILRGIGKQYEKKDKYEKAKEVYREIVYRWPGTKRAVEAQGRLVMLAMEQGEYDDARQEVDKLLTDPDYSRSKWVNGQLLHIIRRYYPLGKDKEFTRINRYIVENWPEEDYAGCAQYAAAGMAWSGLGYPDRVDEVLDALLRDCADRPGLARAVFQIGQGHYRQASWDRQDGRRAESEQEYRKALNIWKMIVDEEIPVRGEDLFIRQLGYHFVGCCHWRLGHYEKALEYFAVVVDYWPEYEYAANASHLARYCYEELVKKGVLSEVEALIQWTEHYDKMVHRFPDSRNHDDALRRLTYNLLSQGKWSEATKCIERYLAECEPTGKIRAQMNYDLGSCYTHLEDKESALACYRKFIELTDAESTRAKALKSKYPELK